VFRIITRVCCCNPHSTVAKLQVAHSAMAVMSPRMQLTCSAPACCCRQQQRACRSAVLLER
jgi:hypothetical protein